MVVPAGQALHTRAPISFWYEPEFQNRQYWYFVSCARAILNILVSRFMISPFVAFPFIQFLFMPRFRNWLESFWLMSQIVFVPFKEQNEAVDWHIQRSCYTWQARPPQVPAGHGAHSSVDLTAFEVPVGQALQDTAPAPSCCCPAGHASQMWVAPSSTKAWHARCCGCSMVPQERRTRMQQNVAVSWLLDSVAGNKGLASTEQKATAHHAGTFVRLAFCKLV